MKRVSVREARLHLSDLLDAAASGEEVIIERRGQPTARLVAMAPAERAKLHSRADFRASLPMGRHSTADVVRALRDEERG